MRNFYIFQIKSEIEILLKDNPYELFHTLQTIYYRTGDERAQYLIANQIIDKIDMKNMDISLFKRFQENYFYTKYKNIHAMHDVYRKENTILSLHKSYIKLQTNVIKPRFLEELKKYHRLFICDFETIDYFWLDSLSIASFL